MESTKKKSERAKKGVETKANNKSSTAIVAANNSSTAAVAKQRSFALVKPPEKKKPPIAVDPTHQYSVQNNYKGEYLLLLC